MTGMDTRKKFWINWFMGGAAGALGAFGIGLIVGAAWMFFWPVSVSLTTTTGVLLATISGVVLKISTKRHDQIMRQLQQERDAENTAQ